MLLDALTRHLKANPVMELDLHTTNPLNFIFNKLRKHVLDKYVSADALALLNSEGTRKAPGVSPDSVPAGVPLPQMPDVVNLPAIPNKVTPAPA
jgi:hypothetical protein